MSKNEPKIKGFADSSPDVEEPPQDRPGVDGFGNVRVEDVLILPVHKELNRDLASELAEAWNRRGKGHGPDNPILVRRVKERIEGEEVEKIALVAGAHRLEAARLVGLERIYCRYVQGDEIEVRIVQIEENLYRKKLTALQHAEQMTEWVGLVLKKGYISGQRVQKRKLGRPTGGISEVARQLPLVARSIGARRKIIERARKIADIVPAAKEAAVAAGLDNSGKALRQIAKAGGRKAQLRKVKKLAKERKELRRVKSPSTQSMPTAPDSPNDLNESGKTVESREEKSQEKVPDTTLDQLEQSWKQASLHKLWAYTPVEVRQQFVEYLLRARRKSKADVSKFIIEVFTGRERVYCEDLYAFAKSKGVPKNVLSLYLKRDRYRRKNGQRRGGAPWFYRNINPDWKDELKLILDTDFEAPLAAERHAAESASSSDAFDREFDDYLDIKSKKRSRD